MELAIHSKNLTKFYRDSKVVDDLNLRIPRGFLHGLIGPNGAGKTTTLKMLSGISRPTFGSASIVGYDVVRQPQEVKKIIGYLPENPEPYKSLTVTELLDFVGALYHLPESVLESRAAECLDRFELEELRNHLIGSLSKGELQRVLLCSVFIREPTILLLDEPFYALDPLGSRVLRELLREKCEGGATVLLATHFLDFAERICDSFTVLSHGKTIADGSLEEFRKKFGSDLSLEDAFVKLTENRGSGIGSMAPY